MAFIGFGSRVKLLFAAVNSNLGTAKPSPVFRALSVMLLYGRRFFMFQVVFASGLSKLLPSQPPPVKAVLFYSMGITVGLCRFFPSAVHARAFLPALYAAAHPTALEVLLCGFFGRGWHTIRNCVFYNNQVVKYAAQIAAKTPRR